LGQIRAKAKLTKKLHKGFGKGLYRRAQGINHNMAHHIPKGIVQFALAHEASVIVFEDLQGWKPKGGRKRSILKQRFHGWLHRLLVQLTENKFVEVGGKVELLYPGGTPSRAYDGSGKLVRSKANYALATFQTGKQYNCDLNGSCNIAARYWAYKKSWRTEMVASCLPAKVPEVSRECRLPCLPYGIGTLHLNNEA
jgi:IS605 OrfB family transposase